MYDIAINHQTQQAFLTAGGIHTRGTEGKIFSRRKSIIDKHKRSLEIFYCEDYSP
ncbi:MAG: hypothetical protein IJR63_05120 [Synergistaceae bacterium]|nr:hypothetical protein [Synergistaceae bacterium]